MAGKVDLELAQALVTSSDEVLSGTPVIRGTRVPVYDVAACVAAGFSIERILESYPSLDAQQVRLAALYAKANPSPPGVQAPRVLPEGAVLISSRTVGRSKKAS